MITEAGRLLAQRSYTSDDGEHGYGVVKAQWTPDSQFFVFSVVSSGGHQPWRSPVEYFNRKTHGFFNLDDVLNDAVINPEVVIGAPDTVTVDLLLAKKAVTVSLSTLKLSR